MLNVRVMYIATRWSAWWRLPWYLHAFQHESLLPVMQRLRHVSRDVGNTEYFLRGSLGHWDYSRHGRGITLEGYSKCARAVEASIPPWPDPCVATGRWYCAFSHPPLMTNINPISDSERARLRQYLQKFGEVSFWLPQLWCLNQRARLGMPPGWSPALWLEAAGSDDS